MTAPFAATLRARSLGTDATQLTILDRYGNTVATAFITDETLDELILGLEAYRAAKRMSGAAACAKVVTLMHDVREQAA